MKAILHLVDALRGAGDTVGVNVHRANPALMRCAEDLAVQSPDNKQGRGETLSPEVADYYEAVARGSGSPKAASNWVMTAVLPSGNRPALDPAGWLPSDGTTSSMAPAAVENASESVGTREKFTCPCANTPSAVHACQREFPLVPTKLSGGMGN